jgi:hypothetical protein
MARCSAATKSGWTAWRSVSIAVRVEILGLVGNCGLSLGWDYPDLFDVLM